MYHLKQINKMIIEFSYTSLYEVDFSTTGFMQFFNFFSMKIDHKTLRPSIQSLFNVS